MATASWSRLFRHAILPSDPHARRVAKEWLTLHMYHNTDRVLSQVQSRPSCDLFLDFDVEYTGPHIIFIEHSHELLSFPMAHVVHVLRHNLNCLWHFDASQVTIESASNTQYYRYRHPRDATWNLLQAYFHEADRCVIVFRRIQEDADEPELKRRQKHVMEWLDIRRVTATTTTVRTLLVTSQARTNDRFLTVDEVAAECGVEMAGVSDDRAKKDMLKAFVVTKARDFAATYNERLVDELSCMLSPDPRNSTNTSLVDVAN
ncbi:hypothetical protein DYB32_008305 [Aphanomyces invadans]|uniref:Uncharacterized protein n=1 Tax=Aphanomyces invadans TaxID=157072 RepID=A0A3R6WH17_9STRA|nr:hypothetical protein DYB32_008305 [Aphanomyces invadans]